MEQALVDTNILIYLLNGEPRIVAFFRKYSKTLFAISMVSLIEVLAGSFHHHKTVKEVTEDLRGFIRIALTESIAIKTAEFIQHDLLKGRLKKRFQDHVIAATALIHRMPLVTNNPKDFKKIPGIRLVRP